MDKRERLEAAIHGAPVDRVPVALWRHWPGDDQHPGELAASHMAFQTEYDWDFVKVTPASSFCLRDWGVKDQWVGNIEGTRDYTDHVVHVPEDWLTLKVLDPTAGALGNQAECLSLLQAKFGSKTPYIQTVFSPLAQMKHLAGPETLLLHMRQNAGQIHHALQTITDTTVRFIQETMQYGIAGIYYALQYANYLNLSEAEYQVFGRPYDLQILDVTKDLWLNVLHIHGGHGMFNLVADYPVQVVNWHDRESPPSLEAGIKRIKGAANGGIDRDVLHFDDPQASLDQARDAFNRTHGRRWIMGTGCVSLVTTPRGNLHKLRALAEEFTAE